MEIRKIALGGGCHWCTEGVFVALRGVERVEQGWVASDPPAEAFSEAVIVHYDAAVVNLRTLLVVHLQTHAATKRHALRHRYRSAVYYLAEEEKPVVSAALSWAARAYDAPVITQVLPFRAFKPSLPEHQDYLRSGPDKPFCKRFIWPKIAGIEPKLLRKNFAQTLEAPPIDDRGWDLVV